MITQVLKSIGEVFAGATAIQRWLTQVARLVAKSTPPDHLTGPSPSASSEDVKVDEEQLMTSMTWTTPLGLVVCQPYRKYDKAQVS